jgi:hypothetical protein
VALVIKRTIICAIIKVYSHFTTPSILVVLIVIRFLIASSMSYISVVVSTALPPKTAKNSCMSVWTFPAISGYALDRYCPIGADLRRN